MPVLIIFLQIIFAFANKFKTIFVLILIIVTKISLTHSLSPRAYTRENNQTLFTIELLWSFIARTQPQHITANNLSLFSRVYALRNSKCPGVLMQQFEVF